MEAAAALLARVQSGSAAPAEVEAWLDADPAHAVAFARVEAAWERAERLKAEVALLVMDLDNFKEINDNHGHHVGDRALRDVSQALRGGIRPYDICVRYAGDYLALPNVVCVGGSWLAPDKLTAAGDWDAIEALARSAVERLASG